MTFSYVNYMFNLPTNYLSQSLSITDSRYPDVQIGRLAETDTLDTATFLQKVQNAVTQYKASNQ